MAHEVFICYASRDKAVAEAVCDALESKNIKCWIAPRDVLIGMQWAESIVDALDSSRVLVLVLSSSSNTSPQVIREIGRAASNDTPIIPIRIDDVVPSKAMDYFVSSHQWLDAQTGPLEKHLQRLVENVQQILARRRPPQEVIEIQEAEEKAKREAEEARKAKEAEEKARREAEEAKKAKEAEEKAKAARPVTYCPKCGAELRPDVSFCPKCGTRVSKAKKVKGVEEARKAKEAEEKAKREAEEARKAKEAEEARKARREIEEARKAREAEEKAKREAEEAKERPSVFAEKFIKPLLKRWWLWAGAGAAVVALILVLVFVLLPPETTSVSPPPPAEEEEEQQPPAEEEEEEVGGAWWVGVWGEPEYGGTLVYRAEFIEVVTDPLDPRSVQFGPWLEALSTDDMRVDRDEFGFLGNYTPLEYRTGLLAESWEQPDPTTVIIHLRQGVVWKGGPAEGREFTSDDIVYTYDKVLGVGEFAGEDPNSVFAAVIPSVAEAVATDRYTVWFHLSSTGLFTIDEVLNPWMSIPIVPREWYEDLTEEEQADWRNVTGTGPFIIEDYADGTSLTYVANPDYYGVDARYPVNKLPYADELKILVVPDMDTALAALRTGQIDLLADTRDYPTLAETQQLVQTNPEINVFHQPVAAPGLFFAWDTEAGTILPPFDDINIRIAMQLAINNALIAETYYMGTVDGTLYGLMSPLVGEDWANPLDEWPAELQAEYGYDLEAAKALMAEAGVSTPFHTEILASTSEDIELLQILQAQFQEIGIDMEIVPMTMMEQRPLVQQGDFELLWTGATGSASNSPSNAIQSFYEGKFEAIGQGARANDSYYNELVEDFLAATTMSEAQAIFREADQYWLEQHWMVIGFPSWSNQFAQPWIKGYMGEHFWCTMTWTYFAHMWIDQDLKTSLGH